MSLRLRDLILISVVVASAVGLILGLENQLPYLKINPDNKTDLPTSPKNNSTDNSPEPPPTKAFTLIASLPNFIGRGGEIEGGRNPLLTVTVGASVNITLINGDGAWHDYIIDELNVSSPLLLTKGEETVVTFKADRVGEFHYYCNVRGHREAGMEGVIRIEE